MSSKQTILENLRRNAPAEMPLPPLAGEGLRFADPAATFDEVLTAIGGSVVRAENVAAVRSHLESLERYREAKRRFSAVADVGESTVDLETIEKPGDLMDLEFAVLPGELAVAENGAVWTHPARLAHRLLYYIAEHLALVVPSDRVVSNMHDAYRALDFSAGQYGSFISGPSKTADIEQSLVIGAQGPRSTVVYLVEP